MNDGSIHCVDAILATVNFCENTIPTLKDLVSLEW